VTVATRGHAHLAALTRPLARLEDELGRLERWATLLVEAFGREGRLLVVGNGGSAAEAQHLTAELVGRYRVDRPPVSAIALHADTSSLTAIVNDFGPAEAFARQVRAHGRQGDVLLVLSTSGSSANAVEAARAAAELGLVALALTGPSPNPLAEECHDALAVRAEEAATVQEVHLVAIHLLCSFVDDRLAARP
jgi:phosphoheptose isomerase